MIYDSTRQTKASPFTFFLTEKRGSYFRKELRQDSPIKSQIYIFNSLHHGGNKIILLIQADQYFCLISLVSWFISNPCRPIGENSPSIR